MLKHVLLFVLFNLFYTSTLSKKFDIPVSVRCINCICQAATACNSKDGCRGETCGPFGISREYWIQSGRPTVNRLKPDDPESFLKCANDFYCSYFAIQKYMEKNTRDCNGDSKIDCDDFVAIHKLGRENCTQQLPESYAERYDYCQSVISD
ncbi:lysozyme 1-like isoform X2 [Photinus pyralis]|uniref:lysozyme n=1 Tax=Photinus pyralis TaxID=7054 RepID=A0A1Y1MBH0_PHOPY|nr:lysozyme 1-like isoform X2 [Photinus pyralis]